MYARIEFETIKLLDYWNTQIWVHLKIEIELKKKIAKKERIIIIIIIWVQWLFLNSWF